MMTGLRGESGAEQVTSLFALQKCPPFIIKLIHIVSMGACMSMSRKIATRIYLTFSLLILMLGSAELALSARPGSSPEAAALAGRITSLTGIERGVCAILGAGNSYLASELAGEGKFVVHMIDPDNSRVEADRKTADQQGLYGRYLSIESGSFSRLPYADNTLDLLVAFHGGVAGKLSKDEALRVLRPLGQALIMGEQAGKAELQKWLQGVDRAAGRIVENPGSWVVLTKPEPEGIDDWSHWEHAPDNNPVSVDKVITAPYMTQFFGLPYYISMPAITTVAGGRVFTAVGHIAHHEREEPWLNTLIAQNGYNGTNLWMRKLPDGYLVHRSAFIATDETFYMINPTGGGCLLLDPVTGEEKGRIQLPGVHGDLKWIALSRGVLYVLAGPQKDPPQTTVVRSPARAWSWNELSSGYYEKQIPWGFGHTVAAYELASGKVLWVHTEPKPIDSRGMVIGGGKLFYYSPETRIACLDALTGELKWENNDPAVRRLIEEPGRGLTSTPGFRTSTLVVYTPQALLYQGQTQMNVVALSTKDGSLLWRREKTINNPNILYVEGKAILGIGREGSTLAVDPLTGKTIEDLGFRKKYCARLTATDDSYFCRGQFEGLARFDKASGRLLFNGAVRPACNDGAIGANGLLYLGPWLCDCNLSLVGRVVFCPDKGFNFKPDLPWQKRLERGQGDFNKVVSLQSGEQDWPTYRGNNERSASTRATVLASADKLWESAPSGHFTPSSATAAGGLIFLGGDDCKVRAVEASTGRLKWVFYTAGPVLQPPTIWQGRAFFGSGDGYIYALEAATGRLLWRFRAAPAERRIMVYGALSSTWPVNTGVLVHQGVAYAAAGITDYDGTYVYALDAVTGELKWENVTCGHLDSQLRKGVSAQGALTVAGGRLWLAAGNIVSPASFDLKTGEYLGLMPRDGRPQANRGADIGVFAGRVVFVGGRLMYSPYENVIDPGNFTAFRLKEDGGADRISDFCVGRIPPAWNERKFVVVNSRYKMQWELEGKLLEGGQHMMPACFPVAAVEEYFKTGKVDSRSRWTFEGATDTDVISLAIAPNAVLAVSESWVLRDRNSKWALQALNPDDGSLLWEQELDGPALSGGLLVDRDGRVIVVLADGRLVCYAGGEV